jgi:hypothetical protein
MGGCYGCVGEFVVWGVESCFDEMGVYIKRIEGINEKA